VKRLLIDSGNTNIKLAQVKGEHWCESDSIQTDRAAQLQLVDYADVHEIWVSNVAGAAVARHIINACEPLKLTPRFISAQSEQCGVKNNYAVPAQLGCDRWAALIGAWHRIEAACLVVSSGTATTVDALSDEGEFLGGLILPGIALMQRSLASATAQLPSCEGRYAAFPLNTDDAILSGAIQAACGAIQRQHALLGVAGAPVLLGGGGASVLSSHLDLSVQRVDNLVLQGLLLIAREEGLE
jgi:type III pantothenate kinase